MDHLAPGIVDVHVGKRLRAKRLSLDLDLVSFALLLNLKPKKLEGYESGLIRIGASTMYDISRALDIPVAYFFEGFAVDDDMTFMARSITTEFLTT